MNMNFSYPTTVNESIFAQMYVFLVLFTIFAFYHDFLSKNWEKYFSICERKYFAIGSCTNNHKQRNIARLNEA